MTPEKKNIYQRLSAIMSAVGNVPKNGYNSFNKYKFVQESDVADIVREACLLHGVMVIPRVDRYTTIETQTKAGERSMLTTVEMHFAFHNVDVPDECVVVKMIGQGQDNQDKGSNKAITGATKYCYLKLFNIGTGDDAEHDGKPDHDYPPAQARRAQASPSQRPMGQVASQGDDSPPPMSDSEITSVAFSLDDDTPGWMQDSPAQAKTAGGVFHYKPPFKLKDRAKELGCRWNGDKKTWDSNKQIPEFDAYIV